MSPWHRGSFKGYQPLLSLLWQPLSLPSRTSFHQANWSLSHHYPESTKAAWRAEASQALHPTTSFLLRLDLCHKRPTPSSLIPVPFSPLSFCDTSHLGPPPNATPASSSASSSPSSATQSCIFNLLWVSLKTFPYSNFILYDGKLLTHSSSACIPKEQNLIPTIPNLNTLSSLQVFHR